MCLVAVGSCVKPRANFRDPAVAIGVQFLDSKRLVKTDFCLTCLWLFIDKYTSALLFSVLGNDKNFYLNK